MEKKLTRALYCLYGVAVIQCLIFIYAVYMSYSLYFDPHTGNLPGVSSFTLLGPGSLMTALVVLLVYYLAPKLKEKSHIGWIGAIGIFILTLPGYGFPVSLFGLICLFDVEVRTHFLELLDIKI